MFLQASVVEKTAFTANSPASEVGIALKKDGTFRLQSEG